MSESQTDEQRRLAEAGEWFLRVHDESATAADIAAWQQWRGSSAEQRRAFAKIEDLWHTLGAVPPHAWRQPDGSEPRSAPPLGPDALDPRPAAPRWSHTDAARPSADAPVAPAAPHVARRYWPRALAAALALAAAAGAILLWRAGDQRIPVLPESAAVRTGPGEHRPYLLTDGSRMDVGASTSLAVQFSPEVRTLVVDTGELYVQVAHDAGRPFEVRAGAGTIRALGTAFNVRNLQGRVAVTVVEGSVQIETTPAAVSLELGPPLVRLEAGQKLVYDREIELVTAADTGAELAWRSGRLQYVREPLRFVIADVSRYTRQRIMLGDPALGELLYTGTVLQGEINDWLKGLGHVFPIRVDHIDERTVVLSAQSKRGQ